MVQKRSILNVVDNSGVRELRCIHVYASKPTASSGDLILGSVKKLRRGVTGSKWKRGARVRGVLISVCKEKKRKNGRWLRLNAVDSMTAIVLRNQKNEPLANRVYGIVLEGIKRRQIGYSKILSLSTYVI